MYYPFCCSMLLFACPRFCLFFNISFSVGLLRWIFSVLMVWNVFILPLLLKDTFTMYRIISWQWLSFNTLKCHCLTFEPLLISSETVAFRLIINLLILTCLFLLSCFYYFHFVLCFQLLKYPHVFFIAIMLCI